MAAQSPRHDKCLFLLSGKIEQSFNQIIHIRCRCLQAVFGVVVAGYGSTIVVMLFMGGVQLMAIGLLGEYIGRIFIESKQRPVYLAMKRTTKPAIRHLHGVQL